MALKVLIVGAGIAGPALALLLQRSNTSHDVTVIERAPGLRKNGLQIDLRAQGLPVIRKLGLERAIRECTVPEDGFAMVGSQGRPWGVLGKNDSGKGQQSMTSEWEIMRGDLVQVLYDASLKEAEKTRASGEGGGVRYEFNKAIVGLEQDPVRDSGVNVTFSDGTTGRYDLVVGADGQWSKTRRLLFGEEASAAMFKSLDLYAAYYTVPREADDDATARWFAAPERRCIVTRSAAGSIPGTSSPSDPRTQVYLSKLQAPSHPTAGATASSKTPPPPRSELARCLRRPVEEQKRVYARAFADAGWQAGRFVREMERAEDFYAQEIGQVKCARPSEGRVALLGDAGYCPAPVTGMGTTVSLVGAYVLAGELARHSEGDGACDVVAALESYNRVVRPYVDEAQKLAPGAPWILFPETAFGVLLMNIIFGILSWSNIFNLILRLMPEDKGGLAIPEYPELNLEP
ncbi:monooxygenase [Biscogniauxia marginata]|nr:monooxygenase [Biscogniauxia marginata]